MAERPELLAASFPCLSSELAPHLFRSVFAHFLQQRFVFSFFLSRPVVIFGWISLLISSIVNLLLVEAVVGLSRSLFVGRCTLLSSRFGCWGLMGIAFPTAWGSGDGLLCCWWGRGSLIGAAPLPLCAVPCWATGCEASVPQEFRGTSAGCASRMWAGSGLP